MRIYECKDKTCGAPDCSTCFPGNDHEREVKEARAEYLAQKGDYMRDMEKDERCE